MDFYELQDFFKQMNPGKSIGYEFDEKCHRVHELIYTDGVPNPVHHIENDKVKVAVEGQKPTYVKIMPHRECATWDHMKKLINAKSDPIQSNS